MGFPEPFARFLEPLEGAAIPYCVTGSVAAGVYGELRSTHDIDFVLRLTVADIAKFRAAFPESDYYLPPTEVLVAELLLVLQPSRFLPLLRQSREAASSNHGLQATSGRSVHGMTP